MGSTCRSHTWRIRLYTWIVLHHILVISVDEIWIWSSRTHWHHIRVKVSGWSSWSSWKSGRWCMAIRHGSSRPRGVLIILWRGSILVWTTLIWKRWRQTGLLKWWPSYWSHHSWVCMGRSLRIVVLILLLRRSGTSVGGSSYAILLILLYLHG